MNNEQEHRGRIFTRPYFRMSGERDHPSLLFISDLCDSLAEKEDNDNPFSFIPTNYRSDSVEIQEILVVRTSRGAQADDFLLRLPGD